MKRIIGFGASKVMRMLPPSGCCSTILPTPSTWPLTKCPPSSSPTFSARSRLTRVPTFQVPSVVTESVSPLTSKAIQPGPFSTTERQQPLQQTEAPKAISAVG